MKKIALLIPDAYLSSFGYFQPYLTADGENRFGDHDYVVNPTGGDFDGVVVHQSTAALDRVYRLRCQPTKTLCVLKEPPNLLQLPDAYTMQFSAVLGQSPSARTKKCIVGQSGHHWFVEIPINQLLEPAPPKRALLSAVVSNKSDTAVHRRRYQFLLRLKEHFGDRLDWFGRGVRDTGSNKLTALRDYRYHIVIENGSWEHYWTEKLADSFAANCFPFYWGAPNASKYFPSGSFVPIDLYDAEASISIIEEGIQADLFAQRQTHLHDARLLLATRYHPYQTYADVLDTLPESRARVVEIRPHSQFAYSLNQRLEVKLKSILAFHRGA